MILVEISVFLASCNDLKIGALLNIWLTYFLCNRELNIYLITYSVFFSYLITGSWFLGALWRYPPLKTCIFIEVFLSKIAFYFHICQLSQICLPRCSMFLYCLGITDFLAVKLFPNYPCKKSRLYFLFIPQLLIYSLVLQERCHRI